MRTLLRRPAHGAQAWTALTASGADPSMSRASRPHVLPASRSVILPIGDAPNPRGIAFVTYLLIALNVAVYVLLTMPLSTMPADRSDPVFQQYVHVVSEVLTRQGVPVEEAVAIGDGITTDIAAAQRVSARSILMLTGVTTREQAEALPPFEQPTWVAADAAELRAILAGLG